MAGRTQRRGEDMDRGFCSVAAPITCLLACVLTATCQTHQQVELPTYVGEHCDLICLNRTSRSASLRVSTGLCPAPGGNCTNTTTPSTCDITDECSSGTHRCHGDADCTDVTDGYTCSCRSGFTGNGICCSDVDECAAASSSVCARHTPRCVNMAGYYTCEAICVTGPFATCARIANSNCQAVGDDAVCICARGYGAIINNVTRRTESCEDLNECRSGPGCGAKEDCIDEPGGFTCSCKTGYTRVSDHCDDLDECSNGHSCGLNATCHNNAGSYNCMCSPGFTGNGHVCHDDDECHMGGHTCWSAQSCVNVPGSFTCTCPSGFRVASPPTGCEVVPECGDGNRSCHTGASCEKVGETYSCVCNLGYIGNGNFCTNLHECDMALHACHGNASCNDTDGSYTCRCRQGYIGNGSQCSNEDECSKSARPRQHDCAPHATCRDTYGSYMCTCNVGYYGTGQLCSEVPVTEGWVIAVVVVCTLAISATAFALTVWLCPSHILARPTKASTNTSDHHSGIPGESTNLCSSGDVTSSPGQFKGDIEYLDVRRDDSADQDVIANNAADDGETGGIANDTGYIPMASARQTKDTRDEYVNVGSEDPKEAGKPASHTAYFTVKDGVEVAATPYTDVVLKRSATVVRRSHSLQEHNVVSPPIQRTALERQHTIAGDDRPSVANRRSRRSGGSSSSCHVNGHEEGDDGVFAEKGGHALCANPAYDLVSTDDLTAAARKKTSTPRGVPETMEVCFPLGMPYEKKSLYPSSNATTDTKYTREDRGRTPHLEMVVLKKAQKRE